MRANSNGFYGEFGGAFIPNNLQNNVDELRNNYRRIIDSPNFQQELASLLKDYCGRPTPLYFSENLSRIYGKKIFLKREDLNHTGAHKINNTLGQVLLARELGKKTVIAETGAGQHGVATATVCAKFGMKCIIFMGEKDAQRQAPNVKRMKLLGAEVYEAKSGSRTLNDAINEALGYWIENPDAYYMIGSIVGPHPYPEITGEFQSVISKEMKLQIKEHTGKSYPDLIIACVGGGSNATGAFYHFIEEEKTDLLMAEAAGEGLETGKHASTTYNGRPGILHGFKSLIIQDEDNNPIESHSISAGLNYPGVGPLCAHLFSSGRAKSVYIKDNEALIAGMRLSRLEGIIPALESSHAMAALDKIDLSKYETIVINLSGRGDKDMETYMNHLDMISELEEYSEIQKVLNKSEHHIFAERL
ncbi:MAG: tryptophan synthase subunit beta [Candidatus Delongbacteria bacterium]|nr:tryptophan synthase subunit beta [Candidatus Delongbacteria bacterium]MBN2834434.1 tryptophan synthase subunit beta [Candidatus Delongbacteria bacterium]